eukprot:TRINITY_DN2466_c0_g1_i3.p1 TRINITY_DN2466_c0_g1~~TRINITY_DN2466_c0_g1_i3.p1  ORF type:complete len:637 (-),score=152.97 TRINITY_DN2466_c0_g1_i3:57-1967(-)
MATYLLIRDVLKYEADLWEIPFGAQTPYDRAALGYVHINAELFPSDDVSSQIAYYTLVTKQLNDVGAQGYVGKAGWFVPPYMVTKEKNDHKILTDYKALTFDDVRKQFPAFDPKKYDIKNNSQRRKMVEKFSCYKTYCPNGYYVPPQCEKNPSKCIELIAANPDYSGGLNEQMIVNFDLPVVIVWLGEGDDGWETEAQRRLKKKENFLMYDWIPTPFIKINNMQRVNFPEWYPECYVNRTFNPDGDIRCDFPADIIQKVAWSTLREVAPSADEFIRRFKVTGLMMDDLFYRLDDSNKSKTVEQEFDAVCGWLKDSDDWTRWIPVPVEPTRNSFGTWAIALIITVAALNMLSCFIMGVAVFIFRKRTIIRLSEPVFLYIMLFGALLISVGAILNVVPDPLETYSCQITVWFICIGFTFVFGSLITKTFRLVWVFFQIKRSGPAMVGFTFKLTHLIYMLGVLLMIDAIILGIWTGADTLEATVVQDDNSLIEYWILCRSEHDVTYIIILAFYKCIIIAIGGVMAFLSRNLPNVLNESYFIFLSIYNVGFFTAIILPVSAILYNDPEASLMVRELGVLLGCFATVALTILPKMYVIYKKKHGAAEDDAVVDNLKVKKSSGGPKSSSRNNTNNSQSGSNH